MRLIQHKREALWFYRFVSVVYERINPLFWTIEMRTASLSLARLDRRDLTTLDVGAGTGFTTQGIVELVEASRVTMLDQSPHQLATAALKPALRECARIQGDAENLPFETDTFDRYVSAGSIEYWPDPQLAITEAYRVLQPDGVALIVGPLPPANSAARWLADLWMLFPAEADYRRWFEAAGFAGVETAYVAPEWHSGETPYGLAIAGAKPLPGASALALAGPSERVDEPLSAMARLRFAARFLLGSLAGLAFVPIAATLALRNRWRRRML